MITFLRQCTTDTGSFRCDVDSNIDGGSLSDSPGIWEDSSRCSWWIRLLIGRNNYSRSCAKKLGGGWEREKVKRTTKRYDDDGHSKVIGLRLMLLAAAVIVAAKPPRPPKETYAKRKRYYSVGTGRKYSQLCVVWNRMDTKLYGAFSPLKCKIQGVGG